MPTITFVYPDGTRKTVDAPVGLSVLEIAHKNDIYELEGSCGGSCACATCHVVVDEKDFGKLNAPTEQEEDMLDMAFNVKKTSRLGCQIKMTEELDGLVLYLP
jgi:2Fe-2S ferredoxin